MAHNWGRMDAVVLRTVGPTYTHIEKRNIVIYPITDVDWMSTNNVNSR